MEHARPPSALSMAEGGPVSRAHAWKRWKQQFMIFLKASGVQTEPASVQSSLLINLIGPDGFDVYETFTFEKEEDKDDIRVLLKKFDAYFDTKGNITLTRYKFFTRVQEDGESIQHAAQTRASGAGASVRAVVNRCDACGSMRCAEGRCSAARAECFVCGNKGHFARMCKLKQSNYYSKNRRVYELECHNNHSDDSADGTLLYVSAIEKDTDHCDEWFELSGIIVDGS
ncbi:unnamed protein product [Leptosia nina]|uniref:CCHC-type domain-containing protein n=1 Tax=Leptosia nina TaxID=320188 RepID=A0AAV1JEB1_9NEOP